jgi:hypothetical protein
LISTTTIIQGYDENQHTNQRKCDASSDQAEICAVRQAGRWKNGQRAKQDWNQNISFENQNENDRPTARTGSRIPIGSAKKTEKRTRRARGLMSEFEMTASGHRPMTVKVVVRHTNAFLLAGPNSELVHNGIKKP